MSLLFTYSWFANPHFSYYVHLHTPPRSALRAPGFSLLASLGANYPPAKCHSCLVSRSYVRCAKWVIRSTWSDAQETHSARIRYVHLIFFRLIGH